MHVIWCYFTEKISARVSVLQESSYNKYESRKQTLLQARQDTSVEDNDVNSSIMADLQDKQGQESEQKIQSMIELVNYIYNSFVVISPRAEHITWNLVCEFVLGRRWILTSFGTRWIDVLMSWGVWFFNVNVDRFGDRLDGINEGHLVTKSVYGCAGPADCLIH